MRRRHAECIDLVSEGGKALYIFSILLFFLYLLFCGLQLNTHFAHIFAGSTSSKFLQLVTMQHASFLHRQRAPRGLRITIQPAAAGIPISSVKVNTMHAYTHTGSRLNSMRVRVLCSWIDVQTSRNDTAAHTLLPGRSKEPCTRGVRPDMPALCQTGHAGHGALRPGHSDR